MIKLYKDWWVNIIQETEKLKGLLNKFQLQKMYLEILRHFGLDSTRGQFQYLVRFDAQWKQNYTLMADLSGDPRCFL